MESHPVSGNPEIEKKFYILGDERVFHTKAPEYFSAIMKKVGIMGTYEPFLVKSGEIDKAVREIRNLNISGANVTIPYKESIIPYLDELSEGATIIGSVNTIVRKGDKLKGYNTNAIGFMDALKDAGFDAVGKSVLVFGTGGAARAVVFILNWVHANSILVTGRSQEKTHAIVNQIGGEAILMNTLLDRVLSVDLVVNATSVSSPDESMEMAEMVNGLQLSNCELVYDLNYGRSQNFWRDMAQSKSIRFLDGLSSLANQAKRTFALWTGVEIKPEIVLTAIHESTSAIKKLDAIDL
jgi:shikimate dehydrogenase